MLLSDITTHLQGKLVGNGALNIEALCLPTQPTQHGIAVVNSSSLLEKVSQSEIAAIVIEEEMTDLAFDKPFIVVKHYKTALIKLLKLFQPKKNNKPQISPSAVLAGNVKLGENVDIKPNVVIGQNSQVANNVSIGANVVIGENVSIGNNTTIYPNVTIYDNSILEHNVTIHSGTTIGSDGFGYHFDGQQHQKIPHIGYVHIESNVEIGANTTIDRATIGCTRIGAGTKVDNLVQIAHNVELGQNNILCAFTGIAGSTKAGNNVVFAANVGIGDHVIIEDNVRLAARTGIQPNKKLEKNSEWFGSLGLPKEEAIKQMIISKQLPKLKKQILSLKQRIAELEKQHIPQ